MSLNYEKRNPSLKKHYPVVLFNFCLILSIFIIYFCFAVDINGNIFRPTLFDYYTYLLDAFFHGRINVTIPQHLDLSVFQSKRYMYWGPAPVLFVLPFYLLSHLQASDVLYTAVAGTANVALFYGAMQEFKKYFGISLSCFADTFLALSFALASPNFFLSVDGRIWFTCQIFGGTYLLLFYLFFFKFLNSDKWYQFILCIIFFYLAFLSRYPLILHGIMFIYLIIHYKSLARAIPKHIIWSFVLLTLVFGTLGASYNYLKFHDIFETGERFADVVPRYAAILKHNQLFSFNYVFHNFYYYFLNVISFSPIKHSVLISIEGNSMFSVYPALLLLAVLFYNREYLNKKRLSFLLVAATTIMLIISLLMLYFATGFVQFGSRYAFDFLPLVFLLLLFILQYIPKSIQIALLFYGIFVNANGILAFYPFAHTVIMHISL